MKYFFPAVFSLSLIFFSSCQTEAEKAKEKAKQDSIAGAALYAKNIHIVDSAEKLMAADKDYNMTHAMGMLKVYNEFIKKYPQDTLTAEYLFRAADLSIGAKQFTQGVNYLETILDQHKGYRKYMDACWVAAVVYDTYLEDVNHGGDRAKQLYEFIIAKYPGTSYAEQSKVLIQYIGKPDSVLVNDVMRKGGK
jgi:TolA-binding protein